MLIIMDSKIIDCKKICKHIRWIQKSFHNSFENLLMLRKKLLKIKHLPILKIFLINNFIFIPSFLKLYLPLLAVFVLLIRWLVFRIAVLSFWHLQRIKYITLYESVKNTKIKTIVHWCILRPIYHNYFWNINIKYESLIHPPTNANIVLHNYPNLNRWS